MQDRSHGFSTTWSAAGRFVNVIQQADGSQLAKAEGLPLRRDTVALLTYVRDNRVTGTQSTGNLPLKAVREVAAKFVHPPELDVSIGDRIYRLRSEDDVWPLVLVHTLAHAGGLLEGGPGQRWRLTPLGAKFLSAPPLIQVLLLFAIWWQDVDWLIAYPFRGMGESLPPHFENITLAQLLILPVGMSIPFEPFADRLIKTTGLKWTAPSQSFAQELLRSSIERMVIGILADFGVVETKMSEKQQGSGHFSELVSFQITPFGKGLLNAL